MTDDNQNETGADTSAKDIISGCYDPKDVSPALVERFKIAQQHVDTWTWQRLRERDIEVVHMDACPGFDASSLRAGGRLWMRQSSDQQLPWEPFMIIIDVVTPQAMSDEEAEVRSLLSSGSPKAIALVESLLAAQPLQPPPHENSCVSITFWSGSQFDAPDALAREHNMPVFGRLSQFGNSYKLSDFERLANDCYLLKWSKLFGCDNAVIPDLRAMFAEVTIDDQAKLERQNIRMRFVKCGTAAARRWHSVYTNAMTT